MIISASRRIDTPALWPVVPEPHSRRFFHGAKAAEITCVSLHPEDVDVIAFWARNLSPVAAHATGVV